MVEAESLDARLASFEAANEQDRQLATVAEKSAAEADASRSLITRIVLVVWAGSILDFCLMLLYSREAAGDVGEVIKTAVLPLVTLVLGYYLSRSQ